MTVALGGIVATAALGAAGIAGAHFTAAPAAPSRPHAANRPDQDLTYVFTDAPASTDMHCRDGLGVDATASALEPGYVPGGPEVRLGAGDHPTIAFCSNTMTAGPGLAAGTTTADLYFEGSMQADCVGVHATLLLNATTLGASAPITISRGQRTSRAAIAFETIATTFATGDRLVLRIDIPGGVGCAAAALHWNSATAPSRITLPPAP